jgi:hypothetical protein
MAASVKNIASKKMGRKTVKTSLLPRPKRAKFNREFIIFI